MTLFPEHTEAVHRLRCRKAEPCLCSAIWQYESICNKLYGRREHESTHYNLTYRYGIPSELPVGENSPLKGQKRDSLLHGSWEAFDVILSFSSRMTAAGRALFNRQESSNF